METIVSPEKRLNESLSRKEVTFCEESSILFYAAEDTVNSLNDSKKHIVKNDSFPLSPETVNSVKNSKCTSEQCLSNLPEAMVVLEKLSEDLFQKYAYFNNDVHCCLMHTRMKNADKTLLNSDSCHLENFTEISPVLQKNIYPLRNLKLSLPDKFINEDCEIEKVCSTVGTRNISSKVPNLNKIIEDNAKRKPITVSKNSTKHSVFTDPPLDSIQQSFLQNCSVRLPSPTRSKIPEPVNKSNIGKKTYLKLINSATPVDIISQRNCGKISFDKYPCIHLEKLNLEPYLESDSSTYDNYFQSKRDVPMDLDKEVGNIINNMAGLSVSQESDSLNEVFSKTVHSLSPIIDVEGNSDLSLSENIHSKKSKESVLPSNSPKIPTNNFLPKSNSRDEAFLQKENIVNDINCENSSLYRNTWNRFPVVLLERLNLPLIETDFGKDSSELLCADSVPADINENDLPIQINNVCSISREIFNKTQNCNKKFSKNIVKKNQKKNKSSQKLCYANQLKKNTMTLINPTSSHVNSFNNSESLENLSTTSNDSVSENVPLVSLSKQKSMNAQKFHFTDSSSNDSVSEDIPLISLLKHKCSMHRNISLVDLNKGLTQTNISNTKSCKHKKRNFIKGNASSSLRKSNAKLTVATKTKNLHKSQQYKENFFNCNSNTSKKPSTSKKPLNSQTLFKGSNKMIKSNKCNKSIELSPLIKKKKKRSFKKKQRKIYKMMIKYLKMQIKSKKHKKKSNKKKRQKKSENLASSNNQDDSDSNNSIVLIYDSIGQTDTNSFEKDEETSDQCKTVPFGESSTVKRNDKSKKHKKNIDKYRLGFLSNKTSLRFYNKFLASERLLLSKCKKAKKKELKRLLNRLKATGFMNYK